MNLAALVAVAAATVNVVTALLAVSVSRAPGWRAAKVIGCVAATAGRPAQRVSPHEPKAAAADAVQKP